MKNNVLSFGAPGEKRSPVTSDAGTARLPDPFSAQSRSHNESAVATPTSTTFTSQSENASVVGNSKQDPKGKRNSGYGSHVYQGRPNPWVTAKEFQPSLTSDASRTPTLALESTRRAVPNFNTTHLGGNAVSGLETIWSQDDRSRSLHQQIHQIDFRPVLPASENDHSAQNDGYGNGPRFDGTTDVLSELSLNSQPTPRVDLRSNTYQQVVYPNTSRVRQHKVEQPQDVELYLSGAWSQGSYSQQNNAINILRTSLDRPYIPMSGHVSNGVYQNDFMPKYGGQQGAHAINTSVELGFHSRQQYDEYAGQAIRPFTTQTYNDNHYSTSLNGMVGVRNGGYGLDPALATYALNDPALNRQNESSQICRSPLLEEFRMNGKTKKYELKDIYDHIVEFSGDQLGSRFIQHKLEVANSDEKDRVFSEIARDSRQLMTDVFGNYVIQKLFEHGSQSQKKVLASHMKGHVFALSTQTYGCRVVQKALEHILTDQQASLIKELDGRVLKVVEDQNGNHVIQKAIERVPGEHIQFIVDAHRGHVHYLSKHPYGCRVVQRMLEHCQPRAKRQILDELHLNISDLIQDAFGNYVVQHVIVSGEPQDRKPVIDKVQSKLMENAMHKFASNVVEKALDYAEEQQCRAMLHKLTARDENGQSQIIKLLSHQYGNYVIRK